MLLNRKSVHSSLSMIPVFSFGLSLIINYIVVFFLAYFNIYTRLSLIGLLIAEFVFLAIVFLTKWVNIKPYNVRKSISDFLHEIQLLTNVQKSTYDLIKFILFILSLLLLISLTGVLISDAGKVFESWDAIFSWNKWAIEFSNNGMPVSTYHYPQLIPANWSVAYVLCKYPFQFIPRTIMHLFLILPVYAFIVIGIKQRSAFYYLTAFFIFLCFKGDNFFWTDGFADVAVAYFSAMVYISLVMIEEKDNESEKLKYILLSALFACGASVTKQAGIFLILIYPLFLFVLSKNVFVWTSRKAFKMFAYMLFSLIVIVLPYYLWAEMAIKNGQAASEIGYVTHDIFKGASFSERLMSANSTFLNLFSDKTLFTCCLVFFALSFTNKTIRSLNVIYVIPYYLVWALFFSYSIRNVAVILPYFSLGIGFGLDMILRKVQKPVGLFQYIKIKKSIVSKVILMIFIIAIPAGIFIFNKKVDLVKLKASQDFRLKDLGYKEVNQNLYLYNAKSPISKYIFTDYQYLKLLPEIGQYYFGGQIKNIIPKSEILNDETIGFLLWSPEYADSTEFPSFIEERIRSGSYKELFNQDGFRFIKIR